MANRSDEGGPGTVKLTNPEGEEGKTIKVRSGSPDGDDGAEFTVHLKLGYKAILLVVVFFDIIHLSVREIINRDLFGLIPD